MQTAVGAYTELGNCRLPCGACHSPPVREYVAYGSTNQLHLINCKTYFQTNFDFAINKWIFNNFHSIPRHSNLIFSTQEILLKNCKVCQRQNFVINR